MLSVCFKIVHRLRPTNETLKPFTTLPARTLLAKLYGARTTASRKSTPWAEGEVIDRGDGETWTVVATTAKSIAVQRDRDGALATLGQLGEGRP